MKIKGMMKALFWGAACGVTGSIDMAALPATMVLLDTIQVFKNIKENMSESAAGILNIGVYTGGTAIIDLAAQTVTQSPMASHTVAYGFAELLALCCFAVSADNPMKLMPLTSMLLRLKNKKQQQPQSNNSRPKKVRKAEILATAATKG